MELCKMLPTLMSLLMELVRHPTDNKPLLCLLASMLLKKRSPGLGLVQRAITVALYGNGAHYNVSDSASFTRLTLLDIQMSPAVDNMLFSDRDNQVDRKAV